MFLGPQCMTVTKAQELWYGSRERFFPAKFDLSAVLPIKFAWFMPCVFIWGGLVFALVTDHGGAIALREHHG